MCKPTTIWNSRIRPTNSEDEISPNSVVNLCTYNVQTLYKERLDNFLCEIECINWDIIGLCETKLHNNIVIQVTCGHMLYNSGVDQGKKRTNGVGFLVHRKHVNTVIKYEAFSERLAVLKLRAKFNNVVIIQCYSPTTSHSFEVVEQFYSDIQQVIDTTSKRDILFVNGDFNAKVGDLHTVEPTVVGIHNNAPRGFNDRGEMLVNFCKQNDLVIANTQFQHRVGRMWTWMSPGDRVRNTIDYTPKSYWSWVGKTLLYSLLGGGGTPLLCLLTLHYMSFLSELIT